MSETITIVGNVAGPPERRAIGGGAEVTKFRVGCTQRRFDAQQEKWVDGHTNWFTVSAFRALGEHAFASLHKGQRVIVTGRIKVRSWENDTGRGMAVDIDADAVGHDLLWGTSEFHGAGRSQQSSASTSEKSPDAAAEWAAPGTADTEVWESATHLGEGANADVREPVPAGGDDTPF